MSAVPVPDDLEPVIRENQRERERHEIEEGCRSMGHPWSHNAGNDQGELRGFCFCEHVMYPTDGGDPL